MRRIKHPGTVSSVRTQAAAGAIDFVGFRLEPGLSLLDAISQRLADHGASSAAIALQGGAFSPFSYVMPATSSSPDHAVYFSGRYDPKGQACLRDGCITFGLRNGSPWLHCHAVWTEADGRAGCGHVLPADVLISQPIDVSAWLLRGMDFVVAEDAETNFSLFQPVQAPAADGSQGGRVAYALRVAPNEDFCMALEKACAELDISKAVVRGGVGSLVGAVFDDGRVVEPFITEAFIRQGAINTGSDGGLRADIDISLVDHTGQISEGRLQRGANPVLVTFELVIEPVA